MEECLAIKPDLIFLSLIFSGGSGLIGVKPRGAFTLQVAVARGDRIVPRRCRRPARCRVSGATHHCPSSPPVLPPAAYHSTAHGRLPARTPHTELPLLHLD